MADAQMQRKGWLESFLLVAAPGGIAFGLLWKILTGESAESSTLIGLAFGAIAGAISAGKMVEVQTVQQFADRTAFVTMLDTQLASRDLFPSTQMEGFRVYQSTAGGSFSLGPISLPGLTKRVRVRLEGNTATLVGPRSVISQLTPPAPS